MRTICEAAGVPGQSFGPIIIGVKFVSADAIPRGSAEAYHQDRGEKTTADPDLRIEGRFLQRPSRRLLRYWHVLNPSEPINNQF
jgi:hypothetical protein